ncbi:glycosyl-4,4'-diaponeurosporenoate acyltransferase CrtO family protein [Micromonospora sp. NPDC004336]
MELNARRDRRARLVPLLGAVAVIGAGAATGALFGYGFTFAWVVHFALMAWITGWMRQAQPALSGGYWRARPWEPALHRRLGVWWYARLLRRLGWERVVRGQRSFDGSRSGLAALARDTRRSEFAHLVLASIGLGLAGAALLSGARGAAGWLAVLTVLLHVYPVLLQRAVRARVERVATAAERV